MATMLMNEDEVFFNVRVLALAAVAQCRNDIYVFLRKKQRGASVTHAEKMNALEAVRWLQANETRQLCLALNEGMVNAITQWTEDATGQSPLALDEVSDDQLSFGF